MTERTDFDAYHLAVCREKGAAFVCLADLTLSGKSGDWHVRAGERELRGKWLIGADGAHSVVRKSFGLFPERRSGFAVESVVRVPSDGHEMRFDFGVADEGYGWVFPKGDHLNVGIYSMGKIPQAKKRLREYCARVLGNDELDTIVSHPLPHNGHQFRHVPDTPLLVGDAAGLVDPLMGEGLYNAIRSGQLAAEAVIRMKDGGADPYGSLIEEITRDLKSYRRETLFFYKHLKWGFKAMTSWPISYILMKGYALGKPVRWLKRHAPLIPFLKPEHRQ